MSVPTSSVVHAPAASTAASLLRSGGIACVALLFFLPFMLPIRRTPVPTLDGEMLCAALLCLAALALGLARKKEVIIHWPLPAFLGLLVGVGAVQWLLGMLSYSYSVTALFMATAALFGAYGVGRLLRENGLLDAALHAIAVALVLGALASVGIQVLQFLDVRGLPAWIYFEMERSFPLQPVANVGQPNQLAAYFALAVPATAYLATRVSGRWWPRLVVAVVAAGVAFTLSRMGVLMLAVLTGWLLATRRRQGEDGQGLALALWIGFATGWLLAPHLVAEEAGAGSAIGRFLGAAYSDRTVMWSDALAIAFAHPLLGTGAGEYAAAQYWVTAAGPATLATPYAHNTVLQLAAEFGFPVAIAFSALAAWWLLSDAGRRWLEPAASTILMMGLLLLLHGMLEWSLWVLFVSVPAALLFALAEPGSGQRLRVDPRASLVPVSLAALAYLPLLLTDFDEVSGLAGRLYEEQRVMKGVSFSSVLGIMQVGTSTYFKPHADRMILAVSPLKAPIDEETLARTERVLERLPDAQTIALRIGALALAGKVDEALPHVERLRAFAVTKEKYEASEQHILRTIAGTGDAAEPLRAKLAAFR